MAGLRDKLTRALGGDAPLGFDPLANDEARLASLRVEDIEPDPDQPRKNLGDLDGLMASIARHGIMQPLIVSPLDEKRYRLIAGERRYTAAKALGLRTVPVLIRTVKDHHRLQLQIIENLHRKDLDAFEEAVGYQRLQEEFNLTHEQIAEQIGKSRTYITQVLSLNRVPRKVREECQTSDIPLSRDTLQLIAKQDNEARMREVLDAALHGLPKEEQRERARKGAPRTENAHRKAKRVYPTGHGAIVIVQSTSTRLSDEQIVRALEEAIEQVRQCR